MGLRRDLLSNFNIDLVFIVLPFILGGFAVLINSLCSKDFEKDMEKVDSCENPDRIARPDRISDPEYKSEKIMTQNPKDIRSLVFKKILL